MLRSKKHILVPYCALSQGIRAEGIVRHYPAVVTDVINYLIEKEINIMQMPCPELFFDGIKRQPCGKPNYDNLRNRRVCREVATEVVKMILLIKKGGYEVIGILGVNYSPSCAVDFIGYKRPDKMPGTGIYIEELKKVLKENGLNVPFIGIENYDINSTMQKLRKLIP